MVIKVLAYLTDPADLRSRRNRVYAAFFTEPRPARSCVGGPVGALVREPAAHEA
uniref:Uncharacterized protein n=1 Tax=Nonomuraea gerenzanensis TaxID=93944 RepID=A0A1M4DX94_9ACTN|nr:hypothetical protein BN4615_P666 [Nonomuraea gerenzanensis]